MGSWVEGRMNGVLSAMAQPRQGEPRGLKRSEVGGEGEISSLSAGGGVPVAMK